MGCELNLDLNLKKILIIWMLISTVLEKTLADQENIIKNAQNGKEENKPEYVEVIPTPYHLKRNNPDVDISEINSLFATAKSRRKRKGIFDLINHFPKNWGCDLEGMRASHAKHRLRPGEATHIDDCFSVGKVPEELRDEKYMDPPISSMYTQYTHAYNIPIIGSRYVTKSGLKRACYVVKVMLADRYDIRNSYYKMFGRVALIADTEQQTDLWEYRTWNKEVWNNRVRGLGPTMYIPLTSAGDDNLRCKPKERYYDQDIFVHEFAHAVHHLGASIVIPGFTKRLRAAFEKSVTKQGKWKNKYAASSKEEYFAVGAQYFYDAYRGNEHKDIGVVNRKTLKKYDPYLTALLEEVFPCAKYRLNKLVHRCSWKKCSKNGYKLVFPSKVKAKSTCKLIETSTQMPKVKDCLQFACYYEGNVIHHKGSVCQALRCNGTEPQNLMLSQGAYGYDIYINERMPIMTLKAEKKQKVNQMCTQGPAEKECGVSRNLRKQFGHVNITEQTCRQMGACWDKKQIAPYCFFPGQDAIDKSLNCGEMESRGDCQRNTAYMCLECPLSCSFSDKIYNINLESLKDACMDKHHSCLSWSEGGFCQSDPATLSKLCPVYCGICKATKVIGL